MSREVSTLARARVLDAAEKLFGERGYAAVTLRDIARALGLNHASLYYHVPGGKEELYVEVMQHGLMRHHDGLEAAIAGAGEDWQAQLRAVARWLVSQPPMDITRMRLSDMPSLGAENAALLNRDVYLLLLAPIERIFKRAQPGADASHTILLTGMFLFMVESVHSAPPVGPPMSREKMADAMLDVMVNGLRASVPVAAF